jgi:hypothetical protein
LVTMTVARTSLVGNGTKLPYRMIALALRS